MDARSEVALAEIIQKTFDGVDQAQDFIAAEMPDVVRQLLSWYFTWSLLWWCVGVVALFSLALFLVWAFRSEHFDWNEPNHVWPTLLLGAVTLVLSSIVITTHFDWLKIWIAPKVWLLDYASNLIK